MKANELMIGDWVLKDMNYPEEDPMYTRPDYQPYQIQDGEDIDLACETNCIGDVDVYQPITLTTEILKKNNFLCYDHHEDCYCISGKKMIYTDCREFGIWTRNIAGDWEWFSIGVCQYVHQLQHILKDCGIEKEVEL